MLGRVVNHKGIGADCSYGVWGEKRGDQSLLYAFDAIGPETAVKAVFATMVGNASKLHLQVKRRAPGLVFKDDALAYGCHKEVLMQHPALFRWRFFPQITPDDPYLILYDFKREGQEPLTEWIEWYEYQPLQEHFYQALEQHTIWPCRREWVGALLKRGYGHQLVAPLKHTDNLRYAYIITLNGWDEVLGEALEEDELAFPTWEPLDPTRGNGRGGNGHGKTGLVPPN